MADIIPEGAMPEPFRQRIRARFLHIHGTRLDGRKVKDCLTDAYNACAEELDASGELLTDSRVNDDIPAWVFRGAVEHQWIPYPLLRWIPGSGNLLEGWWISSRHERIPESELNETFAGYRVTKGFTVWFKRMLASRIAHWQAEVWTRAAADLSPRRGPHGGAAPTGIDAAPGQLGVLPIGAAEGGPSADHGPELSGAQDLEPAGIPPTQGPARERPEARPDDRHTPVKSGGQDSDVSSRRPSPIPPRRGPDLDSSRERLQLLDTLARELATIKQDLKGYCTAQGLKGKYPKFLLWEHLQEAELREIIEGAEFKPKAYAKNLVLRKFGITSPETLRKDRKKLQKQKKQNKAAPLS